MNKEDIEVAARLITEIKDAIKELESAFNEKNLKKLATAKTKIMSLQMQIGNKI